MRAQAPHRAALTQGAQYVLRANDRGRLTLAAPRLYPHQWSWDAAFVSIGLARLSVPRAVTELRTVLAGQWQSGMIPHIQFAEGGDYFPGPDRWGTVDAVAAPPDVRTSGICQPPVHAIALAHVVARGRDNGGADRTLVETFLRDSFDQWLAWHRWLSSVRDPTRTGLVEIHHSWESGLDNSPRWDHSYARVAPGEIRPFRRTDLAHVSDTRQRPSDYEYQRYAWLIDQLRSVGYDDDRTRTVVDFRVRDVLMSAILCAASDQLAELAETIGRGAAAAELRLIAARTSEAVAGTVSPVTGLARDFDVRHGEWLRSSTIAGFAPLICVADRTVRDSQLAILNGKDWMAHPELAYPLPTSTSPSSPLFRRTTYWRGPVWPVMSWLLGWALRRYGDLGVADTIRENSLYQLRSGEFAEYYDPFSGWPLGSRNQSWTAAVALEWLAE